MKGKLRIEDLSIGKKVDIDQLSEIYDIMILVGSDKIGDKSGEILYIGERNSDDPMAVAAFHSKKVISPVYHDSEELESYFEE